MDKPEPRPAAAKDRRAARSSEALRNALLALLDRKPLDQITIREIAGEAGVHYATFFRHHPSKEALLDLVAADQIDRLVELTLPVLGSASGAAAFEALAVYVDDHHALWSALLTGGAGGAMREELLGISKRIAAEHPTDGGWLPSELAVVCTVSLIVETLAWWLGRPRGTVPIGEIARILHRLVASIALDPELGAGRVRVRAGAAHDG